MALQASGAISLADIRTEFGGSAPDSLSEYYRGGANVPDTATNSSIPTSGAISLSDFYSTSADITGTITDGATGDFLGWASTSEITGAAIGSVDTTAAPGGNTTEAIVSRVNGGKTTTWDAIVSITGNNTTAFTNIHFPQINSGAGGTLTAAAATKVYNGTGNYTEYRWFGGLSTSVQQYMHNYMNANTTMDFEFDV